MIIIFWIILPSLRGRRAGCLSCTAPGARPGTWSGSPAASASSARSLSGSRPSPWSAPTWRRPSTSCPACSGCTSTQRTWDTRHDGLWSGNDVRLPIEYQLLSGFDRGDWDSHCRGGPRPQWSGFGPRGESRGEAGHGQEQRELLQHQPPALARRGAHEVRSTHNC